MYRDKFKKRKTHFMWLRHNGIKVILNRINDNWMYSNMQKSCIPETTYIKTKERL